MNNTEFNAESYGLLIVDIQGSLANIVDNSEQIIENTVKLISCCQLLSIPVVVLEQNPDGLGATTPQIKESVLNYQPLEKHSFNAVAEPHIKNKLASLNRDNWLVAGIESHICVYQTVQGLIDNGWKVEVISDCVSSRKAADKELALVNMREIGAKVSSLEMSIFQIMQNNKIKQFRDILKIIK